MQSQDQHPAGGKKRRRPHLLRSVPRISQAEAIAAPVHRSELTPAWRPLLAEEGGALASPWHCVGCLPSLFAVGHHHYKLIPDGGGGVALGRRMTVDGSEWPSRGQGPPATRHPDMDLSAARVARPHAADLVKDCRL